MTSARLLRILARLGERDPAGPEPAQLCTVSAELTAMTGAGIMLMSGDGNHGSICTSNSVSAVVEELQYELGEGPCDDAHDAGRPVLEPDLADPATPRWVAFTPPAVDAGVRAIFGFPLRVGGARLGALNLYRDRPGPLTGEQHADALALADVAARSILTWQAGAPPGTLAAELDAGLGLHAVVHQAAGMASIQLGVSVTDALISLRARAFAHERDLVDVARDIVERRLRLGPHRDGSTAD
jgi:hypothetical protein